METVAAGGSFDDRWYATAKRGRRQITRIDGGIWSIRDSSGRGLPPGMSIGEMSPISAVSDQTIASCPTGCKMPMWHMFCTAIASVLLVKMATESNPLFRDQATGGVG